MPTVKFTSALNRFFPSLKEVEVTVNTIPEIIEAIEQKWPGISDYLVDERGKIRQHVNIFIDGEMIQDREQLLDVVKMDSEVYFFQALSGG